MIAAPPITISPKFPPKDAVNLAEMVSSTFFSSSVEVNLPNLHGIVPRGASLQDVHVIAGKGTAMEIRDWKRLYSLYGGDPRQWEKKTGIAETDIFRYELHWYEKNGKMPVDEIKLVRVKKK